MSVNVTDMTYLKSAPGNIEKCILIAASADEFILETFCMAASQKQLQTYICFRNSYSYFTFLTLTSC